MPPRSKRGESTVSEASTTPETSIAKPDAELAVTGLASVIKNSHETELSSEQSDNTPEAEACISLPDYAVARGLEAKTILRYTKNHKLRTIDFMNGDTVVIRFLPLSSVSELDAITHAAGPLPDSAIQTIHPESMFMQAYVDSRGLSTRAAKRLLSAYPDATIIQNKHMQLLPPETVAQFDEFLARTPSLRANDSKKEKQTAPIIRIAKDGSLPSLEKLIEKRTGIKTHIELQAFTRMARVEPMALQFLLQHRKMPAALQQDEESGDYYIDKEFVRPLGHIIQQLPPAAGRPNMQPLIEIMQKCDAKPNEIRRAITLAHSSASSPLLKDTMDCLRTETGLAALHVIAPMGRLIEELLLRARRDVDVEHL